MKKILVLLLGIMFLASCKHECTDPNFIITTKMTSINKVTGKHNDPEPYDAKWHVRGDSVFLCVKAFDEYYPDTKFINDTIVTETEFCFIHFEE